MKKTVTVGMSGGVDSSVAAYLLKEQGYDVIGITMQIWEDELPIQQEENSGCCGFQAVNDARRVASNLGIPYYVMNFKQEFQTHVVDYFINDYIEGRTPNPCIACNRYVKWEALLQRSMAMGSDYIATGHYARVKQLPNGRYTIQNSVTALKDQTYALYNLTQEQLSHTLMPIGDYSKDQIREIASEIGLVVANKPDSQDICFLPDHDYASFIEKKTGITFPVGNFVDLNGNILGQHKGIIHYTIGQRKGLGLSMGTPVFVVDIDTERNEVVIGSNKDTCTDRLLAKKLNFMSISSLEGDMRVIGKIRYSHKGAPCTIHMINEDTLECIFDEPQRAITPGQSVVFYENDYVVGGGIIIKP